MKKIACAVTVAAFVGSTAFAGGLDEPIVEAVEIVDEASTSSAGWLIPLIAVAFVAVAAAD